MPSWGVAPDASLRSAQVKRQPLGCARTRYWQVERGIAMKKPFQEIAEIASRITGFELPVIGGGLSWSPPPAHVEIARRLITYLEDRRVLYQPYDCETGDYVVRSILDIRQRLTADLEQLDRSSPLGKSLSAMRAACRKFLTDVEGIEDDIRLYHRRVWDQDTRDFFIALGELRSVIGIHIAQIAARYGIDVEEELVLILPIFPDGD